MEVLIGKSSINGPFSMAMLNNQRVNHHCPRDEMSKIFQRCFRGNCDVQVWKNLAIAAPIGKDPTWVPNKKVAIEQSLQIRTLPATNRIKLNKQGMIQNKANMHDLTSHSEGLNNTHFQNMR